jgi:hypothetical protein
MWTLQRPQRLRHELSSPTRTLGSWFRIHSKHGCLCARILCSCCSVCSLATGWSLAQGVQPIVYWIKKLKKRPRSNKRTVEPLISVPETFQTITVKFWCRPLFYDFQNSYIYLHCSFTCLSAFICNSFKSKHEILSLVMLLFLILSKKNHKNILFISVYRPAKCHYSAMNADGIAPIQDVRKATVLEIMMIWA